MNVTGTKSIADSQVPDTDSIQGRVSMKQIPNPYREQGCFFCGKDNPIGLKLTFHETETEPNELICRWRPSALYTGFGKILHGGIQSGMFDEIMGWTTLHLADEPGVTGSLEIRFLKPVFVDQEIEVRCRIESRNNRKIHLAAQIRNESGAVCSEASGTYLLLDPEKFNRLVAQ